MSSFSRGFCFLFAGLVLPFAGMSAEDTLVTADQLEPIVVAARKHHLPNAQTVAFSPDGKLVAGGFGGPSNHRFPLKPTSGGIGVWEVASGNLVRWIPEFGDIVRLSFTHDNQAILYGRVYTPGDHLDADTIALIDLDSGQKRKAWDGYVCTASAAADCVAIQHRRGSCSLYSSRNFDAGDSRDIPFQDACSAECLAACPDGKILAVVHCQLEPITVAQGKTPRGRRILLNGLATYSEETLAPLHSLTDNDLHDCTALAVGPKAKLLATGHNHGIVRIFDQQLEKIELLTVAERGYVFPAFSPGGQQLAVLTQPDNAPMWKYAPTASGFEFGRRKTDIPCEVVFHDTETWKPLRRIRFEDGTFNIHHTNGHKAARNPSRLAWSPDGKFILIGANGLQILEARTGKPVQAFDKQ